VTAARKPFVYVSLFCGAGGDTTGALKAVERLGFGKPKQGVRAIAVNHDVFALNAHFENHPDVEHWDCDIETLEPQRALEGDEITVLWGSAPCQPYSDAVGAPYSNPQDRATPTYTIKWIKAGRPKVYIEENVWPIVKKWPDWPKHVQAIKDLGYRVEYRKLNAADYGTPQDRRRLILIAVREDLPLNWPKQIFSDPKKPVPGTRPWRGAIEVIDRSLDCPSIFGRTLKDGRPDDISENARLRMGRYIEEQGRFWEIVADAVRASSGPVRLIDALAAVPESQWPEMVKRVGDELHITPPDPFITKFYNNGVAKPITNPLDTLTAGAAGGHLGVVQVSFTDKSFVLPSRGTKGGIYANKGRHLKRPLNTQVAGKKSSDFVDLRLEMLNPVILPHNGENKAKGQKPRRHPTNQPFPTICASREKAIAFVFLYTYNGKANATDLRRPSTTFTCVERHALVETRIVVKARIEDCYIDVGLRMLTIEEQAGGQGFPPGYRFIGTKKHMQRQVGNAVPPPLAEAVVEGILAPIIEAVAA